VIAVFGAAGKTGRAVAEALHVRGLPPVAVRRLVRPAFDLEDDASVTASTAGADVLYVLAPNMHPDEPGIVARAVRAAHANGITRVIYHSVLRPGIRAMPHHWGKLQAEELLWESGLDVTILQPSAYTQNLLACLHRSELVVPYAVDRPFSLVDLADVAEATARVLTEPGHVGATYELAGPVTTIAALADTLGLTARRARSAQGSRAPDALEAMFDWYDQHGLAGNPAVLGWLLGRPARDPVEVLAAAR
jgi:NAD(P)H dehydrogenase (quinone)